MSPLVPNTDASGLSHPGVVLSSKFYKFLAAVLLMSLPLWLFGSLVFLWLRHAESNLAQSIDPFTVLVFGASNTAVVFVSLLYFFIKSRPQEWTVDEAGITINSRRSSSRHYSWEEVAVFATTAWSAQIRTVSGRRHVLAFCSSGNVDHLVPSTVKRSF